MKKQWIIVLLGSFCMTLNAQQDRQENTEQTDVDSISLGYGLYREVKMAPASAAVIEKKAFANSPHIDIAKALYGKVAGYIKMCHIFLFHGASAPSRQPV